MLEPIDELLIEATSQCVRAAAITEGRLVDAFVAPRHRSGAVGSIFLGRVVRRASGMAAAFVDVGLDRPGLLEIAGPPPVEGAGIVVQIVEEAGEGKGPRVSRRLALAGRYVVLLPEGRGVAVSRRFKAGDRAGLTGAVKRALAPASGAIIREAASGVARESVIEELQSLAARWSEIVKRRDGASPPTCLLDCGDGLAEALDEFAAARPRRIVVGDRSSARALARLAAARHRELVERIEAAPDGEALFDRHDVADALASTEDTVVALPSGGRLVIEPTTALVAVDVDAGAAASTRGGALAVNLEAAAALALQLRLRDLCGTIAVDFIRLRSAGDNTRLLKALAAALGRDRRVPRILGFTAGGLLEIIRPRSRNAAS